MGYREMTHAEYDTINRVHPAAEIALAKVKTITTILRAGEGTRESIAGEIDKILKEYEHEIS